VKNYPQISWQPFGMRPLQVGVIAALISTSLAGILSNPLFTLVNHSVSDVMKLQASNAVAVLEAKATEGRVKPVSVLVDASQKAVSKL
jgi:NAD(P)H-quinone oxidoreductase subunit 2